MNKDKILSRIWYAHLIIAVILAGIAIVFKLTFVADMIPLVLIFGIVVILLKAYCNIKECRKTEVI